MKELLSREQLLKSGVVANNRMNRERVCAGKNSYEQDLRFNPVEFLAERLKSKGSATWLDLCCGEGRALIEAESFFAAKNCSNNLQIIGVDLVGMFRESSPKPKSVTLLKTSVEDYSATQRFDLITCVHGLHYIGDKLSVIQRATGWLEANGLFLANLDLNNLKLNERQSSRSIIASLKNQSFSFDSRRHLLARVGRKEFQLPFKYLGANDAVGANYTGQPAVDSYYQFRQK